MSQNNSGGNRENKRGKEKITKQRGRGDIGEKEVKGEKKGGKRDGARKGGREEGSKEGKKERKKKEEE